MKKTLFVCLLAVLLLPLAASADILVTSLGAELNQGATQAIGWAWAEAPAAAKFDISLCSGGKCSAVAANVSGPSYSWTVGKYKSGSLAAIGTGYTIKVCQSGQSATCRLSDAFAILPPALKNQREVLNLFKKAMANRYNDLNANNKSGISGVNDYILGENGDSTKAKIALATAKNAKIYNKSTIDLLGWFKEEFLKDPTVNTAGNVLNQRDRDGIKQAMVGRYKDLCAVDWTNSVNALKKTYNDLAAKAGARRQTNINACNKTYNDAMAIVNKLTDPALPIKAMKQFIAKEAARLVKENCINQAYDKYYNDDKTPTPVVVGGLAAQTALAAGYPAIGDAYDSCVKDSRVVAWGWQQ